MEIAGVTRVSPSDRAGTGLSEWDPINPDSLVSGAPVQRGSLCDENAETGYLAGVWDCTAFTDSPGPYPSDEFMLLLEGTVILRLPEGGEVRVGPGEAFVIPKGFACQWVMPDYVRKVFMIVDDPAPEGPDNPSLRRVTLPALRLPDAEGAVETAATWFRNATGRMTVATRRHAGGETAPCADEAHALIHVLDGGLALAAGDAEMRFAAGETAYIRAGTALARRVAPGTVTLEARYRP